MPNLTLKAFYFILILTGSNLYASDSRFILKEHIVVDLERQIEWLRCSVGQRWDGVKCAGEIINLSFRRGSKSSGYCWRATRRKMAATFKSGTTVNSLQRMFFSKNR